MSLLVAIPSALVAALAYGASTAVQHSAAQESVRPGGGGLAGLVRNPRWLLAMGGDTFGLMFQVLALATGPVVLIQPILVLALPISLPIARMLGGPRPGPAEFRACAWILGGLAIFFILVGDPGNGSPLSPKRAIVATIVIVVIGLVILAVGYRVGGVVRAAIYGGVAGAWFGFVAVLMDATSTAYKTDGIHAFTTADGLVPLIILIVLGGVSILLTQVAFQVGALGASFPANLSADPVVAVILGAVLLHEDIPVSALYVLAYVVCVVAVVWGAVRLASGPRLNPVPN